MEDDGEDKTWSGAEERAKAAFEAVLSNGAKIQGDHHLVFHTRMSFRIRVLSSGLIGMCRLRVRKVACLSGRQGWGVETFRVCVYWEGSRVEPSWMERQIQYGGEVFGSFTPGIV